MSDDRTWPERWAALRDMDSDSWDGEHERLKALWQTEYRAAFAGFALTRSGWTSENAEDWADAIVDDAFIECAHKSPPRDQARDDVLEAELDGICRRS